MMPPEQRYFFDTTGYPHLEGLLQSDELQQAQATVQRYIATPSGDLPPGFAPQNGIYPHGFSFDKALESHVGSTDSNLLSFPDEILDRISPETRALIEFAPRDRVKDIVRRDEVIIS